MIKKMVQEILAKGMGQVELAAKIGVTQSRISQFASSEIEIKTSYLTYERLKSLHKKVMRRK